MQPLTALYLKSTKPTKEEFETQFDIKYISPQDKKEALKFSRALNKHSVNMHVI
jgi:hypothetical protein